MSDAVNVLVKGCQLDEYVDVKTPSFKESQGADQCCGDLRELLTWNVSVIGPWASLHDARFLYNALGVEVLAVYDGRRYLGVLTCSRVEQMIATSRGSNRQFVVGDVMERSIEPVSPDELLTNAYFRMRLAGYTSLPMLDSDGKLIGLLSTDAVEAHFPNLTCPSHN